MKIIRLTIKFKTTRNQPRIIIVEDISPEGSQGEYCKAKAKTKQILQIKAILEKNNKLGMGQLGVKLHYFAQSNPESFKTQSMRDAGQYFSAGKALISLFYGFIINI